MSADVRWRPVVGYEGLYSVSDQGRVWSVPRIDALGRFRGGRFLTTKSGDPYTQVTLSRDGKWRSLNVHTLVLTAFVGPRPAGMQGCHGNGDPRDNRLENLRWDTPRANNFDTVAHGKNYNANKTHCPQGHAYTPENVYAAEGHGRQCRTCIKKRNDSRYRNPAKVRVAGERAGVRT